MLCPRLLLPLPCNCAFSEAHSPSMNKATKIPFVRISGIVARSQGQSSQGSSCQCRNGGHARPSHADAQGASIPFALIGDHKRGIRFYPRRTMAVSSRVLRNKFAGLVDGWAWRNNLPADKTRNTCQPHGACCPPNPGTRDRSSSIIPQHTTTVQDAAACMRPAGGFRRNDPASGCAHVVGS